MSFLDSAFDLSPTCYDPAVLEPSRRLLLLGIQRVAPGWLDDPSGFMAGYWNSDAQSSACKLLQVAQAFGRLQRQVTRKSQRTLWSKLALLTRANSEAAFEEIVAELEVARILSYRVSPVALEPLVPEGMEFAPERPRSPDLAIRLPGGDIFIEVTTSHIDFVDKWERAAGRIQAGFERAIAKRDVMRWVEFQFPLRFEQSDIDRMLAKSLQRAIVMTNAGDERIGLSGGTGVLTWGTVDTYAGSESPSARRQGFSIVASPGVNVTFGPMSSVRWKIAQPIPASADEDVIQSVRRTLDAKRKQYRGHSPYVVAVGLGTPRIKWDWLLPKLRPRLWGNDRYERVSAVIAVTVREDFSKRGTGSHLNLVANPNAIHPVPISLLEMFQGRQFHLGATT